MKLNVLLLLGLILTTGLLNAQTDFRPGYIINSTGDTIFGEIDNRGDLLMSRVCKFKDKENEIRKYYPNDITAFRFIDGKYYVSREIDSTKVFLEYLINGKINIYFIRDDSGDHFYIDKKDENITELPYKEEVKRIGEKHYLIESKKHIAILNYFTHDAPGLDSRINSIKKPERRNLIKVAKDYHNAVGKGEYIIYEKVAPLILISPEFIGGVIKYPNVAGLDNKFYIHTGIIGHLWMPKSNDKMYFRTGVLFSQLNYNSVQSSYFRIPLQIEYIYPKGIFRPRLAYGFNVNAPHYYPLTISVNFGGLIKLSESLYLSATSEFEFESSYLFLPDGLLSYSIQLGLFLNIK